MKFGVQLPHFGPLASGQGALALARHAEALGFDSVWVGDHIIYPTTLTARFGAEFHEALVTLTWVAAQTSRVRVGTAVLVVPYRNPIVAAKALATVDALSGGRLTVGVGVGWLTEEFAALGVPFADRGATTDRSLRMMRALWTGEKPFGDMVFAPHPVQRPTPPIWVGGNAPRAIRRAAELGDGWLPIWHAPTGRGFTPAALRDKITVLHAHRARAGRTGPFEIAALMPLAIPQRPTAPPQPLIGAADALVEMLHAYGATGVDHVVLNPYYGIAPELLPRSLPEVEAVLGRFAREVRPRL